MGAICNYINDIAFVSVKYLQLPPMQQSVINFLLYDCLTLMFCIQMNLLFILFYLLVWISNNDNWFYHYFHYSSNNLEDITCFNFDKFVTLPWFVLMTAGLSLSCSNKPLSNFLSKVINR